MKISTIERSCESTSEENTYTGSAAFLYSSKITGGVDLDGVCEILAESEAFSFALSSSGKIYFTENKRLRSQRLNIESTIAEQGMTVTGHNDFLKAKPGDSNAFAFSLALDLLLSDKKLFNSAYGFPTESARIFMRPIAIRCEADDEHELIIPYLRVYKGGVISISLSIFPGFEKSTAEKVVCNEVNKSLHNLGSVLCEKEMYLACVECQIAQMSRRERFVQREAFEHMMKASLNAPGKMEFVTERLTVYELIHTDQFTLTDLARNLLSVVGRAIAAGAVQNRIKWYGNQYKDESIGQHWRGKPIIFIESHTAQKRSSSENWSTHKQLVNSVMARAFLTGEAILADLNLKDMRRFDDFNNFYSEPVSMMLASLQVEAFVKQYDSYTFNNLKSDVHVLNEASHFMQIYYSYAVWGLGNCKTVIDVARLELDVLEFEESLLSAHKYGEVANYIGAILEGEQLILLDKLLRKKIETVRKSLELDEKVRSESYARRITIFFGVIASATLSPELMQPFTKYIGLAPSDGDLAKIYGIGASVFVVMTLLLISRYVFKLYDWVAKNLKGR